MHVVVEKDVNKFLEKYEDWLKKDTVENSLMLDILKQAKGAIYDKIVCFIVLREDKTFIIAIQTPPYNVVLSKTDNVLSIRPLVKEIIDYGLDFSGVVGLVNEVEVFTGLYSRYTGREFKKDIEKSIYALSEVSAPEGIVGEVVFATEKDVEKVSEWRFFCEDEIYGMFQNPSLEKIKEKYKLIIEDGGLVFWSVDGEFVSMVSFLEIGDLGRIASVFTPKEYRGHGYAGVLVAGVSQLLLDRGCKLCCLNTDVKNSTSNSIYKRIGYKSVDKTVNYNLMKNHGMRVILEKNVESFLYKYEEWIKNNCLNNTLMLDVLHSNRGILHQNKNIFCFVVLKKNEPILIAVQNSPHSFFLSECLEDYALILLHKEVVQYGLDFPGITGPEKVVEKFISFYSKKTKKVFLKETY